jgi:D-glycero-D-manno-heptose 1,7-bisphosphate phosphatase
MDGAADAIARARQLGFATVVVSNQSGVARGLFDEDAVRAVNARMDEMLIAQNPHAVIDRHEFCPYHPEAIVERYRRDSDLRKPGCGMIRQAAEALALDLPRSWLIGDAPRDVEAGKAAGCRTILFAPPGVAASPAAEASSTVLPDHAVTSLADAIDYIAHHREPREEDAAVPGDHGERHGMSIPHHAHLPPRVESAARVDDPAADATASPPPHPHAPHAPRHEQGPRDARDARETRDARLHTLAEQILDELRRGNEQPVQDFSVAKMLAGIVQVLTLAVLFVAYLNRRDPVALMNTLVFALTLQTMTIALLIFNRQR